MVHRYGGDPCIGHHQKSILCFYLCRMIWAKFFSDGCTIALLKTLVFVGEYAAVLYLVERLQVDFVVVLLDSEPADLVAVVLVVELQTLLRDLIDDAIVFVLWKIVAMMVAFVLEIVLRILLSDYCASTSKVYFNSCFLVSTFTILVVPKL